MKELIPGVVCVCTEEEFAALDGAYSEVYIEVETGYLRHVNLPRVDMYV